MTIKLLCGCFVNDDGTFQVTKTCSECKECNLVSQLHPFGTGRMR